MDTSHRRHRDTGLPSSVGVSPATPNAGEESLIGAVGGVSPPLATYEALEAEISRLQDEIRIMTERRKIKKGRRADRVVISPPTLSQQSGSDVSDPERPPPPSELSAPVKSFDEEVPAVETARSRATVVDSARVTPPGGGGGRVSEVAEAQRCAETDSGLTGSGNEPPAGSRSRAEVTAHLEGHSVVTPDQETKPPETGSDPSSRGSAAQKRWRKPLTLEKYDGSTPLETFLAKFRNCARYNEWTLDERAVFLRDSLQGGASQILWEIPESAGDEEIIRLLRNRFGNLNQMERYRAELHSRRRKRGESVQVVYQDIRRLMALGFPGQSGELYEIIGRDAFLESLADPALRVRVLDQQPKTLDEALAIVSRMEAYSASITDDDDGFSRRKVRVVAESPRHESETDKRIRSLEQTVSEQKREIQRLKSNAVRPDESAGYQNPRFGSNFQPCTNNDVRTDTPPASTYGSPAGGWIGGGQASQQRVPYSVDGPPAGRYLAPQAQAWTGAESASQQWYSSHPYLAEPGQAGDRPVTRGRETGGQYRPAAGRRPRRGGGRTVPGDTCLRCGGRGHWRAECPVPGSGPVPPAPGASYVQGVANGVMQSETYIDITTKGRTLQCLLDTGCQRSVCPLRICRRANITDVHTELFAANGTPISVVGATRLFFEIESMCVYADVLVSESVDEFILGYDWLERNNCEWLFGQHRIVINGKSVRLRTRPSRASVRRVYVRENVSVPIDSEVNVPVRLPLVNMHSPHTDWLAEPKEVKPGLLMARTLLPDCDDFAAVRIVNVSGVDQSVRSGHSLGVARPCDLNRLSEAEVPHPAWRPRMPPAAELDSYSSREGVSAEASAHGRTHGSDNDPEADGKSVDETFIKVVDSTDVIDEYAHVQPVIDKLPALLTLDQRDAAIQMIRRNADVFSKHEFDVGCTDLLTARILTTDDRPIAEPLRTHARVHLDAIDETISKMKQAGIIEESSSPYSANLVVVPRVDEQGNPTSPRITIDHRKLNSVTYKDKFPLPRTKDCLHALEGSVLFSVLDLSSSYFQVPLDHRDRDKTAFITRKGQFRLTRLGQGCTNSPAVFCRLMSLVLRGLTWVCCLAYVDDTIVFGRTFEEHLENLEKVLHRFRLAKLKLKPTKCKFFQDRVRFLGHHVSAKGLETDSSKVDCIVNWEFPQTISELRSFIGMCSYYRAFCRNFASVAEPLTECLRKGVPLCWTPARQEAFDALKRFLTTAPVLAMPRDDPNCGYVMDVDASLTGAGSILQQWQDGHLKVIEYASRTFSSAERRYCASRREMAAFIFGLKQFRQYLLGRHFLVRVDNMAVSYIRQSKDATGQIARFLDFLADFDFQIELRAGAKSANVDSLSRMRPCERVGGEPCRQCNRRVTGRHSVRTIRTRAQRRREADSVGQSHAEVAQSPAAGRLSGRHRGRRQRPALLKRTAPTAWDAGAANWSPEFLRTRQLGDGDIAPALAWAEQGSRPPWEEVNSFSPMLRSLWQQFDSLAVRNGVLYRSFYNNSGDINHFQLILPCSLKTAFLELVHADAAGHLKFAKCVPHVMRRAWWATWRRDLKLFIRCCARCESYHRGAPPRQANLKPMVIGAPAERWCIDLTGPHRPSNGFRYMFTAVCPFSKFAVVAPIRNKEASTVAKVLVERVFLQWGLCHEILADLGSEFEAELTAELLKLLGIDRLKSSGYRAQTNGACEVYHRTLNSMLAKVIDESQRNWSEWVSYVTFCYNATEHSATGFSPFFIMTGRLPVWNVDILLDGTDMGQDTVPQFTAEVVERMAKASKLVRDHLHAAAESASKWYNRRARHAVFRQGDRVRVYYPRRVTGRSPKWQSYYQTVGVVEKKLDDVTYLVWSDTWRRSKVVHVDKLKAILEFRQ